MPSLLLNFVSSTAPSLSSASQASFWWVSAPRLALPSSAETSSDLAGVLTWTSDRGRPPRAWRTSDTQPRAATRRSIVPPADGNPRQEDGLILLEREEDRRAVRRELRRLDVAVELRRQDARRAARGASTTASLCRP